MTRKRFAIQLRGLGPQVGAFLRRPLGGAVIALFALLLVATLWLVWPYARAGGDIRSGLEHQPSRLWGRGLTVEVGQPLAASQLAARLTGLGYRATDAEPESPGTFRSADDGVEIYLRARPTPRGLRPRERVSVRFAEGRVSALDTGGDPRQALFLGAPLLASYYGPDVREILPVELDELPDHVVGAVLAAEDRTFYHHLGLSPTGIARAAFVNLRQGGVAQGGSTITQQLVKNVFLSHERSLGRKLREAALALLVEAGHTKQEILQAYLNQIYLGTSHGLNLHGIGAAAGHYFGVAPQDLTVAQAATLAGMIRSPGDYTPLRHPEVARERRDQVLAAMVDTGVLDEERLAAARAEPIEALGIDLGARRAPYFADAMAEETRRRFGLGRLGDQGYHLFSTLSPAEQRAAERAVEVTLRALPARDRLEAALVSADPRDGAILAWVGGRDYGASQFDRVRQARRQAGSAFKPVVLAAALAAAGVSPSSRLADRPLVVRAGGRAWRPANSDGRFRGPVTVRRAIEESLNVPTVRLAQQVGLGEVTAMARRLGIDGDLEEVPSLALGAFEVSPIELAHVYATFAAEGARPSLHGLHAVTDAHGRVLGDREPPQSRQVLDPRVAFQVTSVLRGVVTSGTGRGAGRYPIAGVVAGKTGTSNEARDNWFAAYRPDRVTVVWVGHDEPKPTPLSGSRAALPVWGRYAAAAYPPHPPEPPPPPPGILLTEVCRDSGLLPRRACPRRVDEAFLDAQQPQQLCDLHVPRVERAGHRGDRGGRGPGSWLKRKLKKIFR